MAKYQKIRVVSLVKQQTKLKRVYSNISNCIIRNNKLSFYITIKPLETSRDYTVRVEYSISSNPRAYLISPAIETYNGKLPHHIFGKDMFGNAQICFYNSKVGEWNKSMYLADTVVPWISSWLFAYEIWLITGEWHYAEAPSKK